MSAEPLTNRAKQIAAGYPLEYRCAMLNLDRNILVQRYSLLRRANGNGRENVCIFVFDLIKFGLNRLTRYSRIG